MYHLFLCLFQPINPTFLSIFLSIYLSVVLLYPSTQYSLFFLSPKCSTCLYYFYLSVSILLSIYLPIYLSIFLLSSCYLLQALYVFFFFLRHSQSIFLSIFLSVSLIFAVYLSCYLSSCYHLATCFPITLCTLFLFQAFSIYLFVYLSIYLVFILLSIYFSIYLSMYFLSFLPVFQALNVFFFLSSALPGCLAIFQQSDLTFSENILIL